ncbi:FapA family protein [bacterium]|nr:FapA family protein [bacterium]MBU1883387.1 FapA family protein [bacterium]
MQKPTLTRNIDSLLKQFASDTYTPLDSCDFNLLGTVTYIKYPNDETYTKIPNELYEDYSKHINNVTRDKININQIYKITLYEASTCTIKLEYKVHFDEFKTNPKLVILPSSHILYKIIKPKELYFLLKDEINKIKAKNRILVNFHDNGMLEDIKKFVRHIYAGKFTKPVRIQLFDGIAPEISMQSSIDLVFKSKRSPNHQLIEVEEGEVILKYRKPLFGSNGFNCFGKQIEAGEFSADNFNLQVDNESIDTIEEDDMLILKSKKRGFVDYRDGSIAVNNVIKVNKINRVQSKITDDEDNAIEIVVAQNDVTKDSVGEGTEIVSERIHINGHTGSRSVLEATDVVVEGATHKDSNIFARNARINRHKGTLRCNKANVKLLEGGKIHASYAEVETCLGGSIYAKDVVIDHVKSNVTVYASNSITIRLVSGEDNSFVIDYRKIPVIISQISKIDADLDELKFQLEEAIKSNSPQRKTIEDEITVLKNEKNKFKSSSLSASINIKNALTGLNIIKFLLPNNEEIIYKTLPRKYDEFHLKLENDKITLHPVGITREI